MQASNRASNHASNRMVQITKFLQAHGWGKSARDPLPGDASSRRYERLFLNGKKAMLMDAPQALSGAVCVKNASNKQRKDIGYTAMARIAGSDPSAFLCLASALTRRGFLAPAILGADLDAGLILLEDFGDDLFAPVLKKHPEKEEELYTRAVSVLAEIYRSSFSTDISAHDTHWHIGTYDHMALQTEADLFVRWFAPAYDGTLSEEVKKQWEQIWAKAFKTLGAHAHGLALRDFHAENIFDLKGSIGLIDFQDALFAHPSYDLVSLIEDARRDVSPKLAAPLIRQFCNEAGIDGDEKFSAAYAVQGAQRNAKILGIFVRLAQRDGKPHYLDFIPRVAAHFQKDLSHPALAELRTWVQTNAPSVLEMES